MNEHLCDAVVEAIIIDIIRTLPQGILAGYKKPPGRAPSDLSKRLSLIVSKLDDEDAYELIRDVVDASVFTILYLLDNNFKDLAVETVFRRNEEECLPAQCSLLEKYRMRIDPGGIEYTGEEAP